MKVGIVSIFDNNNYGNRLQNYALQQVLLEYADQVVTLKNKPCYSGKSRLARKLPLAESPFLNQLLGKHRRAAMMRFTKKYIRNGRGCYWYDVERTRLKKADRCDLYCAGSDQVWSPACGRTEMFSFLGFAQPEQTFSYAASFGIEQIPAECQEVVRAGLRHVRHISVREDAGKAIVQDLTGRMDAVVVPDPTLLLTPEQWNQVAFAPREGLPKKYMLAFFLGGMSENRRENIRKKAEQLGCALIEMMNPSSPFYNCGPGQFLHLIRYADYVCTDSFHASVFAFLYGRPLAIFDRQGSGSNMGSRLATLSSKYSLEDRLVRDDDLTPVPDTADYSAGYAALELERQKARDYLSEVFQKAKEAGLCD